MRKLFLIALIFMGCKKMVIEKPKEIYYGSCKLKIVDTDGNYIGEQYLIYNEDSNIYNQLAFIDSCTSVGGVYVNQNDSNGIMCYTCNPQMFFDR